MRIQDRNFLRLHKRLNGRRVLLEKRGPGSRKNIKTKCHPVIFEFDSYYRRNPDYIINTIENYMIMRGTDLSVLHFTRW